MHISIFDLFSIGIGPSSSHTVGPMRAAREFIAQQTAQLTQIYRVCIELYGSLALTGKGHGTYNALLMGLMGETPEGIDPDSVNQRADDVRAKNELLLLNQHRIPFHYQNDLLLHYHEVLPKHSNGMRFTTYDANSQPIASQVYYSVGGGFIVTAEEFGLPKVPATPEPYLFDNAIQLLTHCEQQQLTIAEVMLANEKTLRSETDIKTGLLNIATVMENCIHKGCQASGTLPGGLNVTRRAPLLHKKLTAKGRASAHEDIMNWINLFAMSVNEENAAGGRVVTAPTNGAAGIIPAVLQYYKTFCSGADDASVIHYLLTAGAIASLYKKGASISGAEVGCQGEVGVASSMAAGALAAVLGGNIYQVENAAEIAMEHHLGMTCDPVGGLVQIPCIERNAMGAMKAINAARLALMEDGQHKVSLDKVIATMRQTGRDMMTIYKETSQGGLAVNVPEC